MSAGRVTRVSAQGLDWLAELEGGYRLEAYQDSVGVWTISAGVTFWGPGNRVKKGDTLVSEEAARQLFWRRLREVEGWVDAFTRDDLQPYEFDALVAFVYNVGWPRFKTSTLRRYVNERRDEGAIRSAFLMWTKEDKDRDPSTPPVDSDGLLNRRTAEAACYAGLGYPTQADVMARNLV